MAARTWLLLDVSYLCYRAFYAMGDLSHGDVETGVPFGVFRDVITLQQEFQTKHVAFCFDYGKSIRTTICPTYKSKRGEGDPDKEEQRRRVRVQMGLLREEYLPEIGFSNIFAARSYEADDIIASLCRHKRAEDRMVIVSSDHDLYQLLTPSVTIWNPGQGSAYTLGHFTKEFGIEPSQWPDVKAIAGCKSDEVNGIEGIGEVFASKFLSGKLKTTSKTYQKIVAGNAIWRQNLPLVTLPFPGTPQFTLYRDAVEPSNWESVAKRLGMKSLRHQLGIM